MPTALITGASLGFGRALATELILEGWAVIANGRRSGLLDELSRDVGQGTLVPVPGDITDPAHRQQILEEVQRLGSLDLLVNNASSLGPSPLPPLRHYPLKELTDVYQTNVVAPLAMFQLVRRCSRTPAASSSTSPPTPPWKPTKAGAVTDHRRQRWTS
nr:SDR family NAD(P)-dependent oxidoreductase [Arthrobacter sp. H5]